MLFKSQPPSDKYSHPSHRSVSRQKEVPRPLQLHGWPKTRWEQLWSQLDNSCRWQWSRPLIRKLFYSTLFSWRLRAWPLWAPCLRYRLFNTFKVCQEVGLFGLVLSVVFWHENMPRRSGATCAAHMGTPFNRVPHWKVLDRSSCNLSLRGRKRISSWKTRPRIWRTEGTKTGWVFLFQITLWMQ